MLALLCPASLWAQDNVEAVKGEVTEQLEETTSELKEETNKLGAAVQEVLGDVQELTEGTLQGVKESVTEPVEAAKALYEEQLSALKEQLESAKQRAEELRSPEGGPFEWGLELNPNFDGSSSFAFGGDWRYFEAFRLGLEYSQIKRTQADECDRFATSSCKAYSEITDELITLKALGYSLRLAERFTLSFNLNALYLAQARQGTSVDITRDRYVESTAQLTALQLNTELELLWFISPEVSLSIKGSGSPYYKSSEQERGFDSGLISRSPNREDERINENNTIYTGQLGVYSKRHKSDLNYYDGEMTLYLRDLIGPSDVSLSASARAVDYGAKSSRSVIKNGALESIDYESTFSKLDLFASLAFELSFLGLSPYNPMLGATYTRSSYDGVNGLTEAESYGLTVSFMTPPSLER